MKRTNNIINLEELYTPFFTSPENDKFSVKDKATTIDITTHFSTDGRQSVLEQFKELILSEHLLG